MKRLILSKFSNNIQDSWNKLAYQISSTSSRDANFKDLVEFIHKQTVYLNNPEYSREAFSDLNEKRLGERYLKRMSAQGSMMMSLVNVIYDKKFTTI